MADLQVVKIEGRVQAYQWGGREFIPALLGYANRDALPQAEYWLGAHPSGCASIASDGTPVNQFLTKRSSPPLQFLLKILDVHDMLSIQAHPNKVQAEEGFARENALGIAIDAKNRNYKDASDKPELMVALSEFWLLHGFRPPAEIATLLATHDCLAPLRNAVMHQNLEASFAFALDFSSNEVQSMQRALASELRTRQVLFAKDAPQFWIQRWLRTHPQVENGILSLFFLNLLKLDPGMAIYQQAGLLHAYLEGQNIELMANSDNVLRAGLTPKHIDVAELLRTCTIAPSCPHDFVIHPKKHANGETRFVTPFADFELAEIALKPGKSIAWTATSPEIVLCYCGPVNLRTAGENPFEIKQGDSVLLLPGTEVELHTEMTDARCFKARNLP